MLLFGCLFLTMTSGCGESDKVAPDPEFLKLQKEQKQKLDANPELKQKADERKQKRT